MVDVYGQYIESGKPETWRPIAAEQLPDGRWALKVDTELDLGAASIYISNIKVGSVDQTKTNVRYLKVLDNGTLVATPNPTELYRVADTDDPETGNVSGINYYGFVDINGEWYILKEDLTGATGSYRYLRGSSDYDINWNGRTGLSGWDYFFNIF